MGLIFLWKTNIGHVTIMLQLQNYSVNFFSILKVKHCSAENSKQRGQCLRTFRARAKFFIYFFLPPPKNWATKQLNAINTSSSLQIWCGLLYSMICLNILYKLYHGMILLYFEFYQLIIICENISENYAIQRQ